FIASAACRIEVQTNYPSQRTGTLLSCVYQRRIDGLVSQAPEEVGRALQPLHRRPQNIHDHRLKVAGLCRDGGACTHERSSGGVRQPLEETGTLGASSQNTSGCYPAFRSLPAFEGAGVARRG